MQDRSPLSHAIRDHQTFVRVSPSCTGWFMDQESGRSGPGQRLCNAGNQHPQVWETCGASALET